MSGPVSIAGLGTSTKLIGLTKHTKHGHVPSPVSPHFLAPPAQQSGSGMNELEFLNSVVGGQGPNSGNSQKSGSDSIELETEGAPDLAETLLNRVNQRTGGNLRENNDADSLLKGVGEQKPGNKTNPLAANVTGPTFPLAVSVHEYGSPT